MSWDTAACFKSLCASYTEYKARPSDHAAQDLQRQIDVLLGVTSRGVTLKEFSPRQILYAQSLSVLVSILNDPTFRPAIHIKALMALSQLATDMQTKISLQQTFKLPATLAVFLLKSSSSSNHQLLVQSLLLLQTVSYGLQVNLSTIHLAELLQFLVKKIQSPEADLVLPCLAILANLCRHNHVATSHVKAMDTYKQLNRCLFRFMSNPDLSYSLLSLSVLSSLTLMDEVGEKIVCTKNLQGILGVIFTVLLRKEDLLVRQYAVDLFTDLLICPGMANIAFSEPTHMGEVMNLLHSTEPQLATKVLQLLVEICKNQEWRQKLVPAFVSMSSAADEETQLPDDRTLSPFQAVLHWIARNDEDDHGAQASLLSLAFLREVTESLAALGKVDGFVAQLKRVLPVLLDNIQIKFVDDEHVLKQKCRRLSAVVEALLAMWKLPALRGDVADTIDMSKLGGTTQLMLSTYSEDLHSMRNISLECSEEIVYAAVRCMQLMSGLRHSVSNGVDRYSSLIKDEKLIPFLSHAVQSQNEYLVRAALQIMAEGTKAPDFRLHDLGSLLAARNKLRSEEIVRLREQDAAMTGSTHSFPLPASQPCPQALQDISNKKVVEVSESVLSLSEKLKSGLELKDAKMSEIMEFYEHKLASVMSKENNLQDLLEAKALALSQCDRLLAQYRCRQAQSEAECLKLRNLLKDAEKKGESQSQQIQNLIGNRQSLEKHLESLQGNLKLLEGVSEENKELSAALHEQSQKLDSVRRSLQLSYEERQSLAEMNDFLRKHNEKLKSQVDVSNERLLQADEERQKLTQSLKDKDVKFSELKKGLQTFEQQAREKQQELDDLLQAGRAQEKEIKKLEKALSDSKHKISSLQLLCDKHEETLKEKELTIASLHGELEKHAQITAMINNLTSGKIDVKLK